MVKSCSAPLMLFRCLIVLFYAFWQGEAAGQDQVDLSAKKMTVSYCVDPEWMPYEAIRNGKHVGISAEYIAYIQKHSNLRFQLLTTQTWEESLAHLQSGKCEVASMLNRTPERDRYLNFTDHIFDAANVFVSKDAGSFVSGYENLQGRNLGVVRSYRHAEYIARFYPDLKVTLVNNEKEGLIALNNGDIDVFVGSMLSVTAYIQQFGFRELKIIGLAKPHDNLSMGVIKGREDIRLALNEVIQRIPEEVHVEIFRQWNNVKVIDEVDYRYIWIGIAIFMAVLGLFGLRNRYVSRYNQMLVTKNEMLEQLQDELLEKNESLEFLSNHDTLTGLVNRHYMIERCEDEILRMNRFEQPACFLLFDIDYFKQINDSYGHSAGDRVLVEMSDLVKAHCRNIDVCCRWGGEEFLILCPQTKLSEAFALANRLAKAINSHEFDKVGAITCSIGLAEFQFEEAFVHWFDRADAALYEAKENGRNQIATAAM